jgi:hypothetical protein
MQADAVKRRIQRRRREPPPDEARLEDAADVRLRTGGVARLDTSPDRMAPLALGVLGTRSQRVLSFAIYIVRDAVLVAFMGMVDSGLR